MALTKKQIFQEVERLFAGNNTVGWSMAVTIVDQDGVPVSVGGGGGGAGGALETTQQAVLTELLTKADESTLQSVLAALMGTLNVSITNSAVEIVNDVGNPIPVQGTVSVTGVATQATLASVLAALLGTLNVAITNSSIEVSNDLGNPVPVVVPDTVLTPTSITTSTVGTVAANAFSVGFWVRTGNCTIDGISYPAGATVDFDGVIGFRHGVIAYDATGGTLVIVEER